jgi:dihydroorotase
VEQLKAVKGHLPVTADVSMHHLFLTEQDLSEFEANCHLYPPLRTIRDREALLEGVASGVIDAVCSDHRPLHAIAKLAPFADTIPGMSTMDVFLSLGIALVKNQQISLTRLVDAISSQPSRILGLHKGALTPQQTADICIVDPNKPWEVTDRSLLSQGKNCAFKGWEMPAQVTHVIHQGKLVYGS